ncbi:Fe-S cluster assembly protein SufD [Hyphomicrobium sulfonivorans]|nr:Fe-S cluster assembly protein SufD [Hyphomicrobium sulfonivorans]NSL72943.1 Fe-S cluster assembly protein SufD [Hyphomicrobium sulfonivorans]
MNVAIMKTKAEQALSEAFASRAGELPGGEAAAKLRLEALGHFGALGLPHRRVEEWKYTDLRNAMKEALPPASGKASLPSNAEVISVLGPLATFPAHRVVFVDGRFAPDLSDLVADGAVTVSSLATALEDGGDVAELLAAAGSESNAVVALNSAYATDGAVIDIAAEVALDRPVLVVHLRADGDAVTTTVRNIVRIGEASEATVVEAFVKLPGAATDYRCNTLTKVAVGKGAKLSHVKATLEAGAGIHLANWLVDLDAKANYRAFHLTAGTGLARNELLITFAGEESEIDLSGTFIARHGEHVDTTLVVDHAVPRCISRELFKGVLDDHARGVFQGKVIVRQDAQKTDGKQMAQVLMLSPDCEFDSKPELEIYADDVVCGHGSTSADLDEDLVFYCRSRGIPLAQARALLIESFVGEAIEKVEREDVRDALADIAREWLHRAAAEKVAA